MCVLQSGEGRSREKELKEGGAEALKVEKFTHSRTRVKHLFVVVVVVVLVGRNNERGLVCERESEYRRSSSDKSDSASTTHRLTTALPDHLVDWQLCC